MRGLFVILTIVVVSAEFVPFLWFEQSSPDFRRLAAEPSVRNITMSASSRHDSLFFDKGVEYLSDRGGEVTVTVLTWERGNSHALMDAFGHSPEVCLPVSGASLLETLPVHSLNIGERTFQVEGWAFSHPLFPKRIHAFKFSHSAHPDLATLALEKKMIQARLMLFREAQLMPPVQIVIGLVSETNHADQAWERFANFLEHNFQLLPPSP